MKVRVLMLSLIMAITTIGATAAGDAIFSIQLGASAQPDLTKYKNVKRYGYLYTVQASNGMTRAMLGTFSTKARADKMLKLVKSKGFKDAFVTGGKVATTEKIYSVQFASHGYTDKIDWLKAQEFGQVKIDANDGKMRLLSGIFYDKASADAHATTLKQQGYKGAFVRHISEGTLLDVGANTVRTPVATSRGLSVSTALTPEKLPIYKDLSSYERDNIVLLDGKFHIKKGAKTFIPLDQYTPGSMGNIVPISDSSITTSTSTNITTNITTSSTDYRIQLAAVKSYDEAQYTKVNALGTISLEGAGGGLNRVILGNYATQNDARAALRQVKSIGFPNAYMLQYNQGIRGSKVQ